MSHNERTPNSIRCSLMRPNTSLTSKKAPVERALFGGLATKAKPLNGIVRAEHGDYGVPVPSWMKSTSGSSIMEGTKGEELEPTARPEIKEARAKAEAEDAANAAALEEALNLAANAQTDTTPNLPTTPPKPSSVFNTGAVSPPTPPTPPNSMPAGITAGGGLSQVRVYEQLLELRRKMASRLSETNRHARFLEGELSRRDMQVKTAQARVLRVSTDCAQLSKLVNQVAQEVKYSVDKDAMARKLDLVAARLTTLESLLAADIDGLESMSLQAVPISWFGVAESIKLMGSFDNWTAGFELSPEDYTFSGDQTFSVEAQLLPGSYEVKFLVDDEWRISDVWPMTSDDWMTANNILHVEAFTNDPYNLSWDESSEL
eukprot:CAMPEP_0118928440 /NCGR_PEP_ID=MMETSP1169-20130426/5686_1 /TAXON_ID=36882 /ORGANISM="Pyramimonas obovata, Strain CCMP722" /LENGTH=373 /DNA_ID=CAMNT_0006870413 /DNA_START=387 /DNA_END=1508 /DNA_ORIENTATION=-